MNLYKAKVFRKAVKAYKDFARQHLILPRHIRVEVSKLCNLKCVGCRRHLEGNMSRQPGDLHLTLERLKLISQQLPLKVLIFAGDGEPTVNPHFIELLEYVKGQGVRPALTTNGIKMSRELISLLEDCRTIRMSMSITGATKETFEEMRLGAKYEEFIKNLTAVCQADMPVYLNYTMLTPKVISEIPILIRIGRVVHAIGISLMKPYVSDDSFRPPDFHNMREQLKEIKLSIEKVGIDCEGQLNPLPTFRRCYDPWTHPYITLNGDVYGCQYLANQRLTEWYGNQIIDLHTENFIMGNIFSSSLIDIWKSRGYEELRTYMKSTAKPEGAGISREELIEMRQKPDNHRFAYCKGCLYRWGEAGS